jgi:hypothetical protein
MKKAKFLLFFHMMFKIDQGFLLSGAIFIKLALQHLTA